MLTMPETSPLKPDLYPQGDLFLCDVADAIIKDAMPQMEHPFYSLSKKPNTGIKEYHHGDNWIRITPSVKGHATIYDKDLLIYCISKLMDAKKRGELISPRIRIVAHHYLKFTNRGTSGRDYMAFIESLERLRGVSITTNIRTGGKEQTDVFGIIDSASVKRKLGLDGRIEWVEMKLSEWLFNAVEANEVLALHKDYFRLRKPIERRIYEIARKHCGRQNIWKISVDKLLNKSGSSMSKKHFRPVLNKLATSDHLPDYLVEVIGDNVVFTNKGTMFEDDSALDLKPLSADAYDKARQAAPGWDIRHIEQEWYNYVKQKNEPIVSSDKAFIGFCRSWFEKRGRP
jgi:plasmid replication initiation protein